MTDPDGKKRFRKPSLTRQAHASETDVNSIMKKYLSSGLWAHVARQPPRYGDFSSGLEYHEALNKIRAAEEVFEELPSKVRNYVQNDFGKLLDLVYDPARRDELRELGLLPPEAGAVAGGEPETVSAPAEAGAGVPGEPVE